MTVLGDAYTPAVVVHAAVVVGAQQDEVCQGGGSAVGPVPYVVPLAPGGGAGAPGERTATVTYHERGPLFRGDGPGAAVGVQR